MVVYLALDSTLNPSDKNYTEIELKCPIRHNQEPRWVSTQHNEKFSHASNEELELGKLNTNKSYTENGKHKECLKVSL